MYNKTTDGTHITTDMWAKYSKFDIKQRSRVNDVFWTTVRLLKISQSPNYTWKNKMLEMAKNEQVV